MILIVLCRWELLKSSLIGIGSEILWLTGPELKKPNTQPFPVYFGLFFLRWLFAFDEDGVNNAPVVSDPEQIKNCKRKLKAAQKSFACLSNILALAGNEVRLKIICLLEEEKELCPCDLSDILGMSIPAVSQHLRKLKDGNIV